MIPTDRAGAFDRAQAVRTLRFGLGLTGMFLSTVVITLALVAVIAGFVPTWSGTVVASGSMEPALRRGDTVIYAERSIADVGVGTVVVFDNTNDVSIIHRVALVNDDGTLTTKGDANQSNDSGVVSADRFQGAGRLVVPWIGLPRLWWMEGKYLLVIATFIVVALGARSSRMTRDPLNDPWNDSPSVAPADVVFGDRALAMPAALVSATQRERILAVTGPGPDAA